MERKFSCKCSLHFAGYPCGFGWLRLLEGIYVCEQAGARGNLYIVNICHDSFCLLAAPLQLLANIGMEDTVENVSRQLQRASTVWLEMGLWQHWIGQQSVYGIRTPEAVRWVLQQAAHVRHMCFTTATSRAFVLALTMEKHV